MGPTYLGHVTGLPEDCWKLHILLTIEEAKVSLSDFARLQEEIVEHPDIARVQVVQREEFWLQVRE
jgi:hypothetical protein